MTTPRAAVPLDTILLRIGRLNYVWTNTESLLIHLIAGLCRTDKETAVIVFLTLNTTRARIDLVERLAKLSRTPAAERAALLDCTRRLSKLAGVRNHYNHCIYSFDTERGSAHTILMRIADRKDGIRVGQVDPIDETALQNIEDSLQALKELNAELWALILENGYPV